MASHSSQRITNLRSSQSSPVLRRKPVLPPRPRGQVDELAKADTLFQAPPQNCPSHSVNRPSTSNGKPLNNSSDWYSDETVCAPTELGLRSPPSYISGPGETPIEDETPPVADKSSGSKLAKAWEETKYFAGGLIPHPSESTKHYSVLRHSHGIVYYQGPATSLAISIFADRPLPPDRRLWLQQKGWTGSTGWAAKQLFRANGGWLDVTPAVEAMAEQLSSSCERAWQRDCQKFAKKEGDKRGHHLRETCIVRIPSEAEDGYFRFVLCGNGKPKNKLCPSPVFRIISANAAPSSLKGASLSTLPLEVGIKALSGVANNAATNAAQPVLKAVQNTVGRYLPNFWERQAASEVYGKSGIRDKVKTANTVYTDVREASYQHPGVVDHTLHEALYMAPVVGSETGPQPPYPIRVSTTIVPGLGISTRKHAIPTSNLGSVREEVTMPLNGVYLGWARVKPTKKLLKEVEGMVEGTVEGFHPTWHPAIIDVSIVPGMKIDVTYGVKKQMSVHLIHSFSNIAMTGCNVEVVIMGFVREHAPPLKVLDVGERERLLEQDSNNMIADIAITEASLARQFWTIEHAYKLKGWKLDVLVDDQNTDKGLKLSRSLTERYVEARQAAQRQVDRVPIHLLGVRREVDNLRSQAIGTGGIFVRR